MQVTLPKQQYHNASHQKKYNLHDFIWCNWSDDLKNATFIFFGKEKGETEIYKSIQACWQDHWATR